MMNRLKLAMRILSGRPLRGAAFDGALLLTHPEDAECDYATTPPLDLVYADHVGNDPPLMVLQKERFRVCVYRAKAHEACEDCGAPTAWLTLELRGDGRWLHLVTMHESRLGVVLSVLGDAAGALKSKPDEKPTARRP